MARGAAFFDMDRTLVAANTGRVYAEHLHRTGRLSVGQVARVAMLLAGYRLSLIDLTQVMERLIGTMRGTLEATLVEDCAELFGSAVQPTIYQGALERIAAHRESGEPIVIISASTPYLVRPLAEHLAMDGWLCTRPMADDGVFTGDYERPLCYGSGKVEWARRWCDERGLTLAASTFYTDSYSDLPLLAAVGHPYVVNPDLRLWAAAVRRRWPVVRFHKTVGAGQPATHPTAKESE